MSALCSRAADTSCELMANGSRAAAFSGVEGGPSFRLMPNRAASAAGSSRARLTSSSISCSRAVGAAACATEDSRPKAATVANSVGACFI